MLTIARQESSSSTEVPGKIPPVCVVGSVHAAHTEYGAGAVILPACVLVNVVTAALQVQQANMCTSSSRGWYLNRERRRLDKVLQLYRRELLGVVRNWDQ